MNIGNPILKQSTCNRPTFGTTTFSEIDIEATSTSTSMSVVAAAVAVGGWQSHWARWLEKKLDVLGFEVLLTFLNVFGCFGLPWYVFASFAFFWPI